MKDTINTHGYHCVMVDEKVIIKDHNEENWSMEILIGRAECTCRVKQSGDELECCR